MSVIALWKSAPASVAEKCSKKDLPVTFSKAGLPVCTLYSTSSGLKEQQNAGSKNVPFRFRMETGISDRRNSDNRDCVKIPGSTSWNTPSLASARKIRYREGACVPVNFASSSQVFGPLSSKSAICNLPARTIKEDTIKPTLRCQSWSGGGSESVAGVDMVKPPEANSTSQRPGRPLVYRGRRNTSMKEHLSKLDIDGGPKTELSHRR